MKTAELIGPALDWAVAKCEGVKWDPLWKRFTVPDPQNAALSIDFTPSTDWSQGGPIIDRENIGTWPPDDAHPHWTAGMAGVMQAMTGPTPLVAAMRCYVASKLGDEVEIPEELK